jgi:predicted nuclease of predicted toxin-antitoxin system
VKIRFQADADLDPDVGRGFIRRETRIEWRPAEGFIPDATPDSEVLRLAAAAGRVLVSRDVRTIPRHFAAFISTQRSPGVILIPAGTSVGDAIEKLLIACLYWTAEDIENQIRWLPR